MIEIVTILSSLLYLISPFLFQVLLMTLQNAPPGLDYERDKKFSKVLLFSWEFMTDAISEYYHLSAMFFQSFKEMVATCLVKDPKKRPSSEKLLKHSFFKQARSNEYLARAILEGLSPLGDRFRTLKVSCSLSCSVPVLWTL